MRKANEYLQQLFQIATADVAKDFSLYNGMAGHICFLYNLNHLHPNNEVFKRALQLTKSIYFKHRKPPYTFKYDHGIMGFLALFENLDKYKIVNTDIRDHFNEMDRAIAQCIHSASFQNWPDIEDILGVIQFINLRLYGLNVSQLNHRHAFLLNAFIMAIDELERKITCTIRDSDPPLNLLVKCLLFLSKLKTKNLYPEIISQCYQMLYAFLEKLLATSENENQSLYLYYMWKSNLVLGNDALSSEYLLNIYERAGHMALTSENLIEILQQHNRLYLFTGNIFYKEKAKLYIESALGSLQSQPERPNLGLKNASGLGLCILSYLSPKYTEWDELMFLC